MYNLKSTQEEDTMRQKEILALSRFFSASVFKDLSKTGKSELLSKLYLDMQPHFAPKITSDARIADIFDFAYSLLKVPGNRDEYVYKNAIIQKNILGRHSLRTTSVVSEMRSLNSKVDIAVFNGTSTAYEIKSERDTLSRLEQQISDYRKTFASVNIVTLPKFIDPIIELIHEDVGIIELSERYTLNTIRESINKTNRLDKFAIYNSLRTTEINSILKKYYHKDLPVFPNTQIRREYFKLWNDIPVEDLHHGVVNELKKSRSKSNFSDQIASLPESLKSIGVNSKFSEKEYNKLLDSLSKPVSVLYQWR